MVEHIRASDARVGGGGVKLDVVLPNFNGAHLLERYLPGVIEAVDGAQVTVVDDGSTDASLDVLRGFPGVKVVVRTQNGGFSRAVNDGIRAGSGDLVLLLNNDVELARGFLERLLPCFEDEAVFAVSPRIILPNRGNLDEGPASGCWHHGLFYTGQRQASPDTPTPILYATGCAAVYRRSMLETLGGFDEAYSPFYWEDADLGYRAWKRGWKSLYQPASTVYHQHSASISRIDSGFTSRIRARNSLFFIWRNVEDESLLRQHRVWLPLVLAKKVAARDTAWVQGWQEAQARRQEAATARERDSIHQRMSDREIFEVTGAR